MKKLLGKLLALIKTIGKKFTSIKFLITLAIVIALTTGLVYGYTRYNKTDRRSDRVFWGAVDNSLKQTSFSRSSDTKNAGQSSHQVVDVEISPKQSVFSQTKYIQTGLDEANATTENIGTPYADFVRYTSISTSQRGNAGKPYDFSGIINVWAGTQADKSQTNGQQYGQSVLATIPFGNLNSSQRRTLIKMMKDEKVYEVAPVNPIREGLLRRPTYQYNVVLNPSAYVKVLKQFGTYMGLTQLEQLNPKDYEGARKTAFTFEVDGWSHQVTKMAQQSGGRNETISGHGARKTQPVAPTNFISIDELQSRLQSVE